MNKVLLVMALLFLTGCGSAWDDVIKSLQNDNNRQRDQIGELASRLDMLELRVRTLEEKDEIFDTREYAPYRVCLQREQGRAAQEVPCPTPPAACPEPVCDTVCSSATGCERYCYRPMPPCPQGQVCGGPYRWSLP